MVRGRRARTAVQTPAPTLNPSIRLTNGLDADHSCDSPKRKDSKIEDDTVTNECGLQKLQNGLRSKVTQPAIQRARNSGGASVATGSPPITNYFNNIEKKFTNVTINEKTKDKPDKVTATTDENACDGGRMMRTRKQKAPSKLTSPCLQSNNIFLQEPVTTLNIDKTETQSASIVLKNSFLENGFSKMLTTGLGSFNGPLYTRYSDDIDIEYVESTSSSGSEKELDKALDLTKPTQVTVIDSTTTTIIINENSNDSGVVVSDGGGSGQLDLSIMACSPNRRRKPATPHRILCPSPVKTVCAELQPTAMTTVTVKSQNAKNAKIPKSRRKLEKKLLEEEKAKPIAYTITAAVQPFKAPVASKTVVSRHTTTDQQTKIDSFYPAVRKSVRKTKKEVEDERTRFIERAIRDGREEGLAVKNFDDKGRGVVATRDFEKHSFVIEYIGDLISVTEANEREQFYAEDDSTGCYMYYFKHKEQQYCIDATAESGKLGRLVNHSRNGNLIPKTYLVNGRPHLVLIAKDDIPAGDELTYDYGDRSKEALKNHPWLAL